MSDPLESFLEGALREFDSPDLAISESAGGQISHYTLIEELGSGGFGIVWRAEQTQPVKREVALKIIKAGMDTREVISRFKAERQALAVLDHPNIAKVFDAGATPAGRPFFVMELVRGLSLTKYCDDHALPLTDRLGLFVEICRAVQHAHQKGIIHRDLKPSNLLVTLVDGKPVPKVIDFGIAKATGDVRLNDNTLVTRMDRLMGTPAYMSPEQSEPGMDLDTRTDIYSLGVVLYELLTGQVPFHIGADGRVKRERDAQRPSTRIKSLTEAQLQKLGESQRVEGPKLIGLIKGDLDWIAVKALEQDRARRYDSANAFADDILAFLHHQPVNARPPTAWYLITRFTQRNKLAVSAAAAIVLVLLAGIATSTWMYFKEKAALIQSQQVSKFMTQVLEQAGPLKAMGRDHTMLREIMDHTAERIGTELADQPLVQIELRHTLAETYYNLEEQALALKQADEVLRLRRQHTPDDAAGMANALMDRGRILIGMGRNKEAVEVIRPALALRQQVFGADHELTARIHGHLAWALIRAGPENAKEAEQSARIAMEAFRKAPDPSLVISGPNALGMILHRTNRNEEAIKISYEMLAAMKKRFGPEHPRVYYILDNLGYDLCIVKRFDEAEPLLLEAVRQGEKFFPVHGGSRDHIYASLLTIAAQRKDWDLQLKYARQHLAFTQRPNQPDPRDVRAAAAQLARVLMTNAERCLDEAWKTKSSASAQQATAFLDELRTSKDFEPDVKTNASWLDCLGGYLLMLDTTKREDGKAILSRAVEALKNKPKPVAEDTRRVKKAEAMLAAAK